MFKLTLIVLFVGVMATLTFAASNAPVPNTPAQVLAGRVL